MDERMRHRGDRTSCLQRLTAMGSSVLVILVSATAARAQADAKGSPILPPGEVIVPVVTYVSPLMLSVTEGRPQGEALVSPSFPTEGLLGDNPFAVAPGVMTGYSRENDRIDKPAHAAKYAEAGWNSLKLENDPEKYEKALSNFVTSVLCDPLSTDAHRGRGIAFMALGCYQEALSDFDFVLAKEPQRDELYPRRAFLRAMLAEFHSDESLKAAERDLERSRKGNTDEAIARGARGAIALKRGDPQRAIGELSWAEQHGYDNPGTRVCRGQARIQVGDFPRAIADFEKAIQWVPAWAQIHGWLAICHVETGKPELALVDYENALKLDPENVEVLCAHFILALEIRNYEVALADLDGLATRHPDLPWTYFLRGLVRWIDGKDLALVKADIDHAIELEPREWTFHALRAAFQCKRTQYAKTLGDIARCCLVLRRTEFQFLWNLEPSGDGHGQFSFALFWHPEGDSHQPNDRAKPGDLDHRLADLGIKTLWALAYR